MIHICAIPRDLYLKLNRSKEIDDFFKVKNVGKCIDLIEQYYRSTSEPTPKGWEEFYGEAQGWDGLRIAVEEMCKIYPDADPQHIKKYVYHRVISQTWDGLNMELILMQDLAYNFTKLNISKTSFEVDHEYCIDIEVRDGDEILCGIQVKPLSYQHMSSPHQLRAKQNHYRKNEQYKQKYAPYVYVYYNKATGELLDVQNLFNYIKTLSNSANTQTYKW